MRGCWFWWGVLAVGSAAAEEPRIVQLKSKPVVVEPHLPSQRTDRAGYRPLEDVLRIGTSLFPVKRGKKKLKVAVKAGGKPSKTVGRAGATLKLAVGGETPKKVVVRIRRRGAEAWEHAILSAVEFEVDRVKVRFLDQNGDGRFTLAEDVYQLPPSPFVLPLDGGPLILGRNSLVIEDLPEDGRSLRGKLAPLHGSRQQTDGLLAINTLRVSVGLPPTRIDPQLSDACTKHARYLRLNRWHPAKGNPHFEARGRKGYTPEGHRAGMMSVIYWGAHPPAVQAHWVTYYHRFAFHHPRLARIGINDGSPSMSVIDGNSMTRWGEAEGWKDPILIPADGASGMDTAFNRGGERPAPVENEGTRGFPMTVLFLSRRPGVTEFRGTLVRVDKRGDEELVKTLVPKPLRAGNRFGLIPERPLRSSATYRATYTFKRDGKVETASATFETK